LNLFENGRAASPRIGLKRQKFPVFSRETGNTEAETGSPMTASTANTLSLEFDNEPDAAPLGSVGVGNSSRAATAILAPFFLS
jgi:hypothetical protein